jgi:predicted AlkP superfamily phosphohydrolase/phosphomutase
MNFVRMFTNACAAGMLAAAYVIVLVLLLNPALPLAPWVLAPLILSIGAYYSGSVALAVFAALMLRHLFGRGRVSPAWVSVNVLVWLSAIVAATGAAVMWANLRTFALVLEDATLDAMVRSALVVASAAILLLATGVLQRYGRRRTVWAACMVAIALISIVSPLAMRGPAKPPSFAARPVGELPPVPLATSSARVSIIALDAGSLEVIANATAEGRLPNFGRILDAGAVAHLATLHPTSVEAVWSAAATGKLPQKNGVRSSAVYRLASQPDGLALQLLPDFCFASGLVRFGLFREEPRTSTSLRTRTLWEILGAAGIRVGVINFPLTYPAPIVNGYVVSGEYARQRRSTRDTEPAAVYPAGLLADPETAGYAAPDGSLTGPGLAAVPERYRAGARADRIYERVHRALNESSPVQVSLLRYESTDPIAHYFLRYTMPSRFGDVSEEDRRQYGGVLEAHYAIVDAAIGREISALGADDLLVVVSGFGIEPLSVSKRVLERLIGDPEISGTHEAAPDGFLMAYGASVGRSGQLRRASVVDVVPTILYFLGLPVGRDMDGYARTDLFQRAFTDEHPITFIPTYDR